MDLLPNDSETLVVSKSAGQVLHLLNKASASQNVVYDEHEHAKKLFVGNVHHHSFHLSIRPKRPNSYIPVMSGEVESTSSGSIVFVTYKLFPSTRQYLSLWSLFVVAVGIVGGVQLSAFYLPASCILILLLIHYIAWANFRMQVRISRDILMKALA